MNCNRINKNEISTPMISLETPFGEPSKSLNDLLEYMEGSWKTASTGVETGATGDFEDDTVDSKEQPKSKTRRGGRKQCSSETLVKPAP
mmetsp:Transcript_14071/g.18351  ORF Transcript_14071/g.18351 Transcript_14071/m.18351 type:complete len:89 (-) Transcript_14071:284-550(-)